MSGKRLSQRALRELGIAEDQITPPDCGMDMCYVPVPHKHEPPSEAMVLESRETLTLEHPPTCEWRKDVYGSCSCGMTGLVTQLYTLKAVVMDAALAAPVSPSPDLVLVRRDTGGVFPDGTTNHPAIDFDAPPQETPVSPSPDVEGPPTITELAGALYETDPPESWMRTATDEYRKRATTMLAVISRDRRESGS